jgi:hypothetical protein
MRPRAAPGGTAAGDGTAPGGGSCLQPADQPKKAAVNDAVVKNPATHARHEPPSLAWAEAPRTTRSRARTFLDADFFRVCFVMAKAR